MPVMCDPLCFGAARVRTRERTTVQEFRVHEPSLQGEVDVQ